MNTPRHSGHQAARTAHGSAGLSLVELLVVLGIIAILGGLTAPAILSFLPSDDLEGDTRELFTTLKFAQVHAVSQRVDTAVVYSLDNYVSPTLDPDNDAPLRDPITDSITEQFARIGVAYVVAEKIENDALIEALLAIDNSLVAEKLYAPLDAEQGQFTVFEPEVGLLFMDPTYGTGLNATEFNAFYYRPEPRFNPDAPQNIGALGMNWVYIVFGKEEAEDLLEQGQSPEQGESPEQDVSIENVVEIAAFPAHIFKPTGGMDVNANEERFTLHLAPRPNLQPEERLVAPDQFFAGNYTGSQDARGHHLVTSSLQLYKSTGRVRVVEQ